MKPRPDEPSKDDIVWYRGWECSYDPTAAYWTPEGWLAYKGGCDLDALQISACTWLDLLDEIDAESATADSVEAYDPDWGLRGGGKAQSA